MSDEPEQFPKRVKGRVRVRHRTTAEARRQEAPPRLGKVKNLHRTGESVDEGGAQQRGVGKMENDPSQRFVLVAVGLCVLVVALVIWMLVIRPAADREVLIGAGGEGSRLRAEDPESAVSAFVSNATAAEHEAAIEAVVSGFMRSSTNEERCRWVNGGTEVLDKMTEFYSREGVEAPHGFEEITVSSRAPFGGVPMQVVGATAPDDETVHYFNVVPGKDRMLIDWESSVGYGEMAWEAFIEEHPTELVDMRVFLQPDDYYNYEFSDDRKYWCFSITSKESDLELFGYVERDSETAESLMASKPKGGLLPVRVRVKFLPWSVDKKMVWIEELVHPYWINSRTIEETLMR